MSTSLPLLVARMYGVLVTRPRSDVFHVYSGPLTPSGRSIPRAARTVCTARTRRLSVLERDGSVLDLGGRRMCARCSARLSAAARRAEQPISRDQWLAAFGGVDGVTLGDLVVALALAASEDDTYAVGFVASLVHGPMSPSAMRRPAELSKRQARYDLEVEILRLRTKFRSSARTPEEVEATRRKGEADIARDAQILAGRRKAAVMDRAIERRNNGGYLLPHERELIESA